MTSDSEDQQNRPGQPSQDQPSEPDLPEAAASQEPPRPAPPPTTLLDTSRAAGVRRRREPIDGEVVSSRREGGRPPYEAPPDQSMLRNPYIVAGIAVASAIVLAVLVVILFGGGGGGNGDGDNGGIDPLTPQPGAGLLARSIATATVREGPSTEFIEIGTLRSGQDVEVLGRDESARWFQIVFPPRSTLRGWVQASALRIPEASVSAIPVVASTPIPRPTVILPTATAGPTETPTAMPTETGTPTPIGGPDLVAMAVAGTCRENRALIISVRNLGPTPLVSRAITILVQSAQGQQRAIVTQTVNLPVNDTVDINTGYEPGNNERIVAIVDPLGSLGDPNASNNRVDCIVSGSGQQATPANTPRVATPPPIGTP